MSRLWSIVRREYIERVRSKAFIVATILGPILTGSLMVIPALVAAVGESPCGWRSWTPPGRLRAPSRPRSRAKRDGSARFIVEPSAPGTVDSREASLKAGVLEGRLDGYLLLPPDALEKASASYFGKNVSNMIDLRLMEDAVSDISAAPHGRRPGSREDRDLTRKLDLKTIRLSAAGEREDRGVGALFSIILMMMLYVTVLMWGQAVLTGVIEEKTNRVVEVIVSAVTPIHLLAGKLLGVGAAGLTQFLVWALSLAVISVAGASSAAGRGHDCLKSPRCCSCHSSSSSSSATCSIRRSSPRWAPA